MILLVHMLFGAGIGNQIDNIYLAILLAFLGHYFLDIFPHVEYPIPNISSKNWHNIFFDSLKVLLDFLLGILFIFLFSTNQPIIYLCAFIAIVPDGITVINSLFKNKLLQFHQEIHGGKIHYLTKKKKFPIFWRISTQILATAISILMLKI